MDLPDQRICPARMHPIVDLFYDQQRSRRRGQKRCAYGQRAQGAVG
nr:hypothetical protein [Halorhodospira halochloris]